MKGLQVHSRHKLNGWLLLFCLSLSSLSLTAQNAPSADDDVNLEIVEELVVTAEKREKKLQKIPATVAVISGDHIEEANAVSIQDLQRETPGLVISTNGASAQPYLRGVGTDLIVVGAESSTAVYLDGVYLARAYSFLSDLYDVERVEVMKGPQGTLYGRNATAGAINIITRGPEAARYAEGHLSIGDFGYTRLNGTYNTPLGDHSFFRVSAVKTDQDGFTENLFNNTDIDDQDMLSGRARLHSILSNKVNLSLNIDFSKDDGSRNLAPKVDASQPSPARDFFNGTTPADAREVFFDPMVGSEIEHFGASLEIVFDLDFADLKFLTAYRDSSLINLLDIDGTEVALASTATDLTSETLSEEITLTSRGDGPFEWLAGLMYFREEGAHAVDISIFPGTPNATLLEPSADNDVTAYAAFGQVSYAFNERLSTFAGLRYSHEEKDHSVAHVINLALLGVSEDKADWDALTPRLGVNYAPNDRANFYFSASRGFKSGGFNSNAVAPPVDQFEPEYIWSYEAGYRGFLAQDRVSASVTAFHYDYRDLQVNFFDGTATVINNAAKAEIDGLELDLRMKPSPRFAVDLGLAWLDATYTEYLSADPEGGDPSVILDLSGNRMPRAPEFSGNLGLAYTHALQGGSLKFSGNYAFRSEVYFSQFQSEVVKEDDVGLLNARVGYKSGKWEMALFGRNLGDERYSHSVIQNSQLLGTLRFFDPPRTFGLQAGFRY